MLPGIKMPDMDGMVVLGQIREFDVDDGTIDENIVNDAFRIGATDFISSLFISGIKKSFFKLFCER